MSDYEFTDFEELYELYGRDVFNMGLRNSDCNIELAKDGMQQAFLKLYVTMRNDKPVKNVRNFLLTAAKHHVLNAQRINKHMAQPKHPGESVFEGLLVESPESKYLKDMERVDNYETGKSLLEALKKKNETWYVVAIEVFCHNRSQVEVAEEMGMSSASIYAMIRRIREWAESYVNEIGGRDLIE